MKRTRVILALLGMPLLAPAIMYGAAHLFAVSLGSSLSFSLANFYQVGLPYAYAIFLLVGAPTFALLVRLRIKSLLPFIASGAAIFPIMIGFLVGYAAIKNEELNLSGSDGSFVLSAMLTGAVLGAVFWAVAVTGRNAKTQSNI